MSVRLWRAVFDDTGRRGSQEDSLVNECFGPLGQDFEVRICKGCWEGM